MEALYNALRVVSGYSTVMIGLKVQDERVLKIQQAVKLALADLNPEITPELHVSLFRIPKETSREDVEDVMRDVPAYKPKLKALGFGTLPGVYAPFDFLTIKLQVPAALLDYRREIEKEIKMEQMPGGFKVHLTIARFPKGTEKQIQERIKGLEFAPFDVHLESVALWDENANLSQEISL